LPRAVAGEGENDGGGKRRYRRGRVGSIEVAAAAWR
jgi:hypothetical protein